MPPVFGWEIVSDVPIGQGMKSSSALACAALRALDKASWTGLSDFEIVDLAVEAQIRSDVQSLEVWMILGRQCLLDGR